MIQSVEFQRLSAQHLHTAASHSSLIQHPCKLFSGSSRHKQRLSAVEQGTRQKKKTQKTQIILSAHVLTWAYIVSETNTVSLSLRGGVVECLSSLVTSEIFIPAADQVSTSEPANFTRSLSGSPPGHLLLPLPVFINKPLL